MKDPTLDPQVRFYQERARAEKLEKTVRELLIAVRHLRDAPRLHTCGAGGMPKSECSECNIKAITDVTIANAEKAL